MLSVTLPSWASSDSRAVRRSSNALGSGFIVKNIQKISRSLENAVRRDGRRCQKNA
ncbi:hypothetical protein CKA32_005579 [Geitlerinema sp. FC II]|nr:hypothetical protein CKA32_005579 [Geitlerinema sp. FC II]